MTKKIIFFLLIIAFLNSSFLFSQKEKVTVIVKTAKIYAESSESSYEIDRAHLGDVLTLFETWRGEKEWLYVIFRSERWKGEVTGFIKSSQVVRGEVIPDELIETTAEEAETKESKPEDETQEEKDELPSLKDIMKSTKKKEEAIEDLPTEEKAVEPAVPETVKEEELQEPDIEPEPEPVEVKITEFLGETEVGEIRWIKPSEIREEESSVYEIEEALPRAVDAEEAEGKIEPAEEFREEEVKPPSAEEEPEPALEEKPVSEPKLEPEPKIEAEAEPEAIPVKTEVFLGESEISPFRNIVEAEILHHEHRPYRVINTREEAIKLEIRRDELIDVAEAKQTEVEVEPYEIKSVEPEPEEVTDEESKLPPIPVEEEGEEAIKEEIPEEAKPEVAAEKELKTEAEPREKKAKEQEVPPVRQQEPPPELSKPRLRTVQQVGPLLISLGYGPSYGGLGAALQWNTKSGFSIHAGVGYYPAKLSYSQFDWLENQMLFSIGIKYYFSAAHSNLRPYLNLQYGGLTVEAVQVPTGIWYGEKTYENIQKSLYGPSFLVGGEWRMGRMGLNGALGLSYNTTEWEYWERNFFFNGEFAIVVYF